jgi:hypothetical protein
MSRDAVTPEQPFYRRWWFLAGVAALVVVAAVGVWAAGRLGDEEAVDDDPVTPAEDQAAPAPPPEERDCGRFAELPPERVEALLSDADDGARYDEVTGPVTGAWWTDTGLTGPDAEDEDTPVRAAVVSFEDREPVTFLLKSDLPPAQATSGWVVDEPVGPWPTVQATLGSPAGEGLEEALAQPEVAELRACAQAA